MTTYQTPVAQFIQHIADWYRNFEKAPADIEPEVAPHEMKPLVPYRVGENDVLCVYLNEQDEQRAFNLVATAIGSESLPESGAWPKWFHLPPSNKAPEGVRGYLGVRV